ncbi:MAG: hypothetical protein KDD42_01120 [Bdellovibrionales bacterium]|nr:hypothetical protein [Bdellovibrionales bacterium]
MTTERTVNQEETTIIETENSSLAAQANSGNGTQREVSATTIGRMMGLATYADLELITTKLDLFSTKINGMATRMEKVMEAVKGMPSGADLERIDVQIASLRTLIRDTLKQMTGGGPLADQLSDEDNASRMQEGLKKLNVKVKSNQEGED